MGIVHLSGCSTTEDITIVYKDYKSSFAELLSEYKSGKLLPVHHRNVQKLAFLNVSIIYLFICLFVYLSVY